MHDLSFAYTFLFHPFFFLLVFLYTAKFLVSSHCNWLNFLQELNFLNWCIFRTRARHGRNEFPARGNRQMSRRRLVFYGELVEVWHRSLVTVPVDEPVSFHLTKTLKYNPGDSKQSKRYTCSNCVTILCTLYNAILFYFFYIFF